ncbi:hypothetical protein Saro_2705 [Novosphingobium aromaticivorans DSM 12444]|uniref:Uncharacterized protein n=1 Tax=Novosphingobium aromaticivorans (strain ATCC 700278 / DSM 12444 / CCUG 56034 / CIP 105152 / NBRC 16084 / F199) TaxID=279238 RepID=Q2G4T2_NOVAD|nr:hypothetical protein [Novosphingobium aromaticivorans]ABD27141.1 hypothetical protein Saro_2705 [Novosphingobium aromaticivorans DSM 12444]SCY89340.1 hypothetical protein SAMN05660666_03458 [Novosphingobium aromaticivorans]
MLVHKGLRNRTRLTQTSYRSAVSETVKGIQGADSDREMAEVWGVSSGTVVNARNRNADLSAVSLLRLGERFGPAALDTVLHLIGARAVDREAIAVDVSSIPCDVAGVLPMLIDLFRDGECSDADVRTLERAGAIDCLCGIADMLRNKRDAMRTGSVSELRGAA